MKLFGKVRSVAVVMVLVAVSFMFAGSAYCKVEKVGFVDLRRAFYDYDKTKKLEGDLNSATQEKQAKRNKDVEAITKMRDESELLTGDAKKKKQEEIEKKLMELQDSDKVIRQELLNKKNDMFRAVIDDIQKVVADMGEKEKYDFILDSRSIMYNSKEYDLTDEVLKRLNAAKEQR